MDNEQRARAAEHALTCYSRAKEGRVGYDDTESTLVDLVADLMHLALEGGSNPQHVLRRAIQHFEAEGSGSLASLVLPEPPTRMPHWTCKTHGDFDARVAVGCPECMREARPLIRAAAASLIDQAIHMYQLVKDPNPEAAQQLTNRNLLLKQGELNPFTEVLKRRILTHGGALARMRNNDWREVVFRPADPEDGDDTFGSKCERYWWYLNGESPQSHEFDLIEMQP